MVSEWEEVCIGDVAKLQGGYAFKSKDFSISGVPVVKIKNIQNGNVRFHDSQHFPTDMVDAKLDRFFVNKGDVLIAMTGQGSVGRVGRVVCMEDDSALLNQRVGKFIPDETKVDLNYLYYVISEPNYENALFMAGSGSGQPNLSPSQIESFTLNLPPLPEQKAIAHILGSLDDKIELNRQMNQTLEQMAQALFKSWFVDFDPVLDNALAAGNAIPEELQDRANSRIALGAKRKPLPEAIQKLFPAAFVFNEELDKWVPEGWRVSSVEDSLSVNPRVKLPKGSMAKFADMKALPTSGFSIDGVIIKELTSGGSKFEQGDILLARITPCLENGKTGIVDFLNHGESGFGSTEFIVLRGKGAIKTPFVACLSRESSFRDHCILNMVGSSGRQRVQNAAFNNYYIALPKDELLLKFNELSEVQFKKITKQDKEINSLTNLRATLLPKLISGEVRVKDVEQTLK